MRCLAPIGCFKLTWLSLHLVSFQNDHTIQLLYVHMVFDKMPKWSEIWLLCFLIWEFMNFVLIVTWVDTLCGDFWVVGISDILLIFFKSFWLAILTIGVVMCFLQLFFFFFILEITEGTAGRCYEWPPILSRYSKSAHVYSAFDSGNG